jgi:hypothetical protein
MGMLLIVAMIDSGRLLSSVLNKNCGQDFATDVAWMVFNGVAMGSGGLSRRAPVGDIAKGMPLKFSTFSKPGAPIIVASGFEMVTVGPAALLFAGAVRTQGNKPNKINLYSENILACTKPNGTSFD